MKNRAAEPVRTDRVAETRAEYTVSGDSTLDLALRIDATVKRVRPDGWRGIQARGNVIKRALLPILKTEAEVERMFTIIKAQTEY